MWTVKAVWHMDVKEAYSPMGWRSVMRGGVRGGVTDLSDDGHAHVGRHECRQHHHKEGGERGQAPQDPEVPPVGPRGRGRVAPLQHLDRHHGCHTEHGTRGGGGRLIRQREAKDGETGGAAGATKKVTRGIPSSHPCKADMVQRGSVCRTQEGGGAEQHGARVGFIQMGQHPVVLQEVVALAVRV